jgi:hypothetical protein
MKTYTQQDMDYMLERLRQAISERNDAQAVLARIGITPEMITDVGSVPGVTVESFNQVTFEDGDTDRYDSVEDAINCLDRYCEPGETYEIECVQRITHCRVVHTYTTPKDENGE